MGAIKKISAHPLTFSPAQCSASCILFPKMFYALIAFYLTEATEHNPVCRDPGLELLRNENVHEAGGTLDAGLVLPAIRVKAEEVEPGRHLEARVEGDWHLGGGGTDHFHMGGPGK